MKTKAKAPVWSSRGGPWGGISAGGGIGHSSEVIGAAGVVTGCIGHL